MLSYNAYSLGDFRETEKGFRETLSLFEAIGESRWRGYCLRTLAQVLTRWGYYIEAEKYFAASINIGQNFQDLHSLALALRERCYLALALGNFAQVEQDIDVCLAYLKDAKTTLRNASFAFDLLGAAYRLRGQYQKAARYLQEGFQIAKQSELATAIAHNLHHRGRLAYDQQDYLRLISYNKKLKNFTRHKSQATRSKLSYCVI